MQWRKKKMVTRTAYRWFKATQAARGRRMGWQVSLPSSKSSNKSHALGTQRESRKKKAYYLFFFRRFWVKEALHSENQIAKKMYTSIVARVLWRTTVKDKDRRILKPVHYV